MGTRWEPALKELAFSRGLERIIDCVAVSNLLAASPPTIVLLVSCFGQQGRAMNAIAKRLVTLCATLSEFPHIRFAADGGGHTEGVARTFQVCVHFWRHIRPEPWSTRVLFA